MLSGMRYELLIVILYNKNNICTKIKVVQIVPKD